MRLQNSLKLRNGSRQNIMKFTGLKPSFESVGNTTAARNSYEAAIELEPNSAPLRVWFAHFLFRQLQDFDEALRQLTTAEILDPSRFNIQLEIARVALAMKDFTRVDLFVEKLPAIESIFHAADRRKLIDFILRYYKDKAEESCDNGDTASALNFLRLMFKTFVDCPKNLRDQKMSDKLQRSILTVLECKKLMWQQTREVHPDLDAMLEKIGTITGDRLGGYRPELVPTAGPSNDGYISGEVHRLLDGYGFIRANDGKEYLFSLFRGLASDQ